MPTTPDPEPCLPRYAYHSGDQREERKNVMEEGGEGGKKSKIIKYSPK
jgi:hypothetical protein